MYIAHKYSYREVVTGIAERRTCRERWRSQIIHIGTDSRDSLVALAGQTHEADRSDENITSRSEGLIGLLEVACNAAHNLMPGWEASLSDREGAPVYLSLPQRVRNDPAKYLS
jgi:hypothetical protein